ncbi:N-6 DNA methylase [Macrococcoides canis]|uniref:N-6 DNA methylase n=1 Tax=Macrococcoides canis TaxID=1855823 RepID=UPI0020B8B088|nr:N-6 DNA methylase [Macrococcus canis]UTH00529.1 N-6 DNA methylase [Macrococcus canis]
MIDYLKYKEIAEQIFRDVDVLSDEKIYRYRTEIFPVINCIIFYKFMSEKFKRFITEFQAMKDIKEDYETFYNDDVNYEAFIAYLYENVGYLIEPGNFFEDFIEQINEGTFDFLYFKNALLQFTESKYDIVAGERTDILKRKRFDIDDLFTHIDFDSKRLGNRVKDRQATIKHMIKAVDESIKQSRINIDEYMHLFDVIEEMQTVGSFMRRVDNFPLSISNLVSELIEHGANSKSNLYIPFETNGFPTAIMAQQNNFESVHADVWRESEYNMSRLAYIIHDIDNYSVRKSRFLEISSKEESYDVIFTNLLRLRDSKFDFEDFANETNYKYLQENKIFNEKKDSLMNEILERLNENGMMVIISSLSFISNMGEDVFKNLITDSNIVECIIELPKSSLYSSINTPYITILNKARNSDEDIMLIDASRGYVAKDRTNELQPHHISNIMDVYQSKSIKPGLSTLVSAADFYEKIRRFFRMSDFITPILEQEHLDPIQAKEDIKQLSLQIENEQKRIDGLIDTLKLYE